MAYARLLLNAGGGIISTDQQSKQMEKTATVLIGLGGTGVDCLRTVKTQVYARLKPDDPDAIIPQYSHIRFVGVDSDRSSIGVNRIAGADAVPTDARRPLDEATEFFDISNSEVGRAIRDEHTLSLRPEMSWVNTKTPLPNVGQAGAGAIRQIGRYMIMDKADGFMNKVQAAINGAREGLNNPAVHIHIFAGISGGTGSGTFLDVCYMVRKLTEGVNNVKVFGYFFLPDVNISRIDPNEGAITISMIKRNGYVAMQELDYCMSLPENGGSFTQVYKGDKEIAWDKAPVDMCHLVCGTDMAGNVISNPYDYAMNVTAEYVMDFLTKPVVDNFNLSSHQANFVGAVAQASAQKKMGLGLAYCIIGAAAASLPLREINTYLASELFDKFSKIGGAEPTEADVNALAVSSLGLGINEMSGLYQSLLDEVTKDVGIGDFAYYEEDYKYALQDGNSFTDHYANQLAKKRNLLESNAKSMMDAENTASLIGRLRKGLETVICDVNRGPIFAYGMLKAANTHNLMNAIAGQIAENDSRFRQQNGNKDDIRKAYEDAKRDFCERNSHGLFDNDKRRFTEYEWATQEEAKSQIQIDAYIKLGEVLEKLSKQVQEASEGYYFKLAKVMKNLLETFAQNRNDLKEGTYARLDSFSLPLIKIEDIKDILDDEVRKMDIPNMMSAFMQKLLSSESEWLQEDESRIAKLVTVFFEKNAFSDFTNRSINQFLQDKYRRELGINSDNVQLLADYVYRDWIQLLTQKASPLFIKDSSIVAFDGHSGLSYISVPETCTAISMAVEKMHQANNAWNEKQSAITDRIFVMSSLYVLPIASYGYQKMYSREYFLSNTEGNHLYEGGNVPGMVFNNWKYMSPVTPDNVIVDLPKEPELVQKIVGKARSLYQEARNRGLINDSKQILELDPAGVQRLRGLTAQCEGLVANIRTVPQSVQAQTVLDDLMEALNIPLVPSRYQIQNDGLNTPEDQKRVMQDHFVASQNFQIQVEKTISEMDNELSASKAVAEKLQNRIQQIQASIKNTQRYASCLFAGVISIAGPTVTCTIQGVFGPEEKCLCAFGNTAYPFSSIPVYQGYVSFSALSEEEKAALEKTAIERVNGRAPEVGAAVEALAASTLSVTQLNYFRNGAAEYAEQEEIVGFLTQMINQFNQFRAVNGI